MANMVYHKKIIQAPLIGTKLNIFYKNPFVSNSIDEIEEVITELNSFDNKFLFLLNVTKLIHNNLDKKLTTVINPQISETFLSDFNFFLENIFFGDLIFLVLSFYTECIKLGDKKFFTIKFECPKCGAENEAFVTLDDFLNGSLVKPINCHEPFCFRDIVIEKVIDIRKKNIKLYFNFHLPSLKKFFEIGYYYHDNLSFDKESLFVFTIKNIIVEKKSNTLVLEKYNEISELVNNLPTKIFDDVFSFYVENVYKPFIPTLTYEKQCLGCSYKITNELDIFSFFNKNSLVEFLDERLKSKINMYISMYFLSKLNFSNIEDLTKLPPHIAKIIIEQAEKYIEKEKMEYEKIKEGRVK